MGEFTYEKKVKLRNKIQKKVKSKEYLMHVKTILMNHNPNLNMTKNANGYFIDILNLTQPTYVEITKFLDKLDGLKVKDDDLTLSEVSRNAKTDECVDNITKKKLKFNNAESHILNRVKYEKALKKNQSDDVEDVDENGNVYKPGNVFKKITS